MSNRREAIMLIGGAAAWPLAAHAQQPGVPAVGFLHLYRRNPSHTLSMGSAGLTDTGVVEGENVAIGGFGRGTALTCHRRVALLAGVPF